MTSSYFQINAVKKVISLIVISVVVYICYKFNISHPKNNIVEKDIPDWNYYLMEEVEYPIAYGISVYRDPEQFLRLFHAIYRPFNVYCIHVDLSSPKYVHDAVRQLAKTHINVIFPKRFINVVHSEFSVLESELLCMETLYNFKKIKWKYFINLTGQEWPLKVNLELVRILKSLKGANLMEKISINPERIPKSIGPVPYGIQIWKGAVHIIAIRDFVKFALYDKKALTFLNYLRKTIIPDETYFSTLNHDHNLKAPGGYSGDLVRDKVKYPFLNRHKIWKDEGVCHGTFVRSICVFSMEDVPAMIDTDNKSLFANKFIMNINGNVLDFMERWFYNRTKTVYANANINPFINLTFYSQLEVVNNHF